MQHLVAFARALAHAGEHRDALVASTMAWISSITSTVLPTPAPPNIAALPPWASGVSRSITLMPVANMSVAARLAASEGGGAMDRPLRRFRPKRDAVVGRLAEHVDEAAEHVVADGRHDRTASHRHRRAAPQTLGRFQCDRAHGMFVQMGLDLGDDRRRPGVDQNGFENFGQCALDLDVEHGAAHGGHAARSGQR